MPLVRYKLVRYEYTPYNRWTGQSFPPEKRWYAEGVEVKDCCLEIAGEAHFGYTVTNDHQVEKVKYGSGEWDSDSESYEFVTEWKYCPYCADPVKLECVGKFDRSRKSRRRSSP